jgi:hypothetical protein
MHKWNRVWASGVLLLLIASATTLANPLTRRVRPLSDRGERLLAAGIELSPTIADLLDRIEQSDIIVQVDMKYAFDVPFAVTRLVTATPQARYVRVSINPRHSPTRRLELLGHELQHVVEIAEDETVRSQDDMREYFTRIGRRHLASTGFETEAAIGAELQVRREVNHARSGALSRLR